MRAFLGAFLGALVGRRGLKGIGGALFALYVVAFVVVRWLLDHPAVTVLLLIALAVWLVHKADRGPSFHLPGVSGRRTCLYRLWDDRGLLLYVGIAYDPDEREAQHRSEPVKRFWTWRIARRTDRWFDSREEAKRAESEAIRREHPLFNVSEARTS